MKKLLLVLTITLTLLLGACNSAPDDNDLENRLLALETELNATQEDVASIQSYLDRMVWSGYLLPENQEEDYTAMTGLYVSVNFMETLGDKEVEQVDTSKFPAYIWNDTDLDGVIDDYISMNEMCNLLTQKYLNMPSKCSTDFRLKLQITSHDQFTNEEFIVRLSMMIMELSEYDFYIEDNIHIEMVSGASEYINIPKGLLTTPKYDGAITPQVFWLEMFEIEIHNLNYDVTLLNAIYDEFVLNGTFTGYVLPNFK